MESAAEFHFGIKWDDLGAFTQAHWRAAWHSSREAIVIDLPPMPAAQRTDEEATFSAGGCDMRRKCADAIKAAGLKVKPLCA